MDGAPSRDDVESETDERLMSSRDHEHNYHTSSILAANPLAFHSSVSLIDFSAAATGCRNKLGEPGSCTCCFWAPDALHYWPDRGDVCGWLFVEAECLSIPRPICLIDARMQVGILPSLLLRSAHSIPNNVGLMGELEQYCQVRP